MHILLLVPWLWQMAAQVIFAKVIFQLDVFCEDGSLNYDTCPSMCGREMPLTALLGLVQSSGGPQVASNGMSSPTASGFSLKNGP
jgi:hypothetical protein